MKDRFSDKQIVDFLRKSYFAVDGLWFVNTEEKRGFDEAMDQDEAVWDVMSKIQARKAKAILGIGDGSIESLARAFALKLAAEGYEFGMEQSERELSITVNLCPWYEVLKSSGRTHMSQTIAERICAREFGGWVDEFAPGTEFRMNGRLCVESDKCEQCTMSFKAI